MQIQKYIQDKLVQAATHLSLPLKAVDIVLDRPTVQSYGDYATSVALSLFSKAKKNSTELHFANSRELAEALTKQLNVQLSAESVQYVKNVQVAGPGFINFTLSDQFYFEVIRELLLDQENSFNAPKTAGTIIIEYISPNSNKPLHIGHVRNAALGVSISRLLTKTGWDVKRAIINNDRGLHIMKSVWGYLTLGRVAQTVNEPAPTTASTVLASNDLLKNWKESLTEWMENPETWLTPERMSEPRLQKPDHFVGHWYQQAEKFAEEETVKSAWSEMLQAWEQSDHAEHEKIRQIWKRMNGWFYQGFTETAKLLKAEFDPEHISYESEVYEAGRQVILEGVEKGIFERLPDGAVRANLGQFKLADKIMIRRDGTGLYILQDIELLKKRASVKPDKSVYIVGVDQELYFKQLFAIAELLGYGQRDHYHHFAYGMVRLPEGKMSSRKGLVVYADDLLSLATQQAREIMEQTGVAGHFSPEELTQISQAIGVGAVQWTMLSHDPTSEVIFDIEKSVNFTGFAGPYIQYTLARTHSIFKKVENSSINLQFDTLVSKSTAFELPLNEDERAVVVQLSKYFDTVEKAAREFAPHTLCLYLDALAQSFNTLYAHQKIISEDQTKTTLGLALTKAVQMVITDGLTLLGIEPIERM